MKHKMNSLMSMISFLSRERSEGIGFKTISYKTMMNKERYKDDWIMEEASHKMFSLKHAVQKDNDEVLTCFLYIKDRNRGSSQNLLSSKLASIKHKSIIEIKGYIENDEEIMVVSSYSITLMQYLKMFDKENSKNYPLVNIIILRIFELAHGILALHNNEIFHGNLSDICSYVVEVESGQWKICRSMLSDWDFKDILNYHTEERDSSDAIPPEYRFFNSEVSFKDFVRVDSWNFGKLIHSIFCEISIPIPSRLNMLVKSLLESNIRRRIGISEFLKSEVFDNKLIRVVSLMDTIHKNSSEENVFVESSISEEFIRHYPRNFFLSRVFCREMINGYDKMSSKCLITIIDLGKHMGMNTFEKTIIPFVIRVFGEKPSNTERAGDTNMAFMMECKIILLKNMSQLNAKISSAIYTNKIYPILLSIIQHENVGFKDIVIKVLFEYIEKIPDKSVYGLVRIIQNLLTSRSSIVRLNSLIFIGKIFCLKKFEKDGTKIITYSIIKGINDPVIESKKIALNILKMNMNLLDMRDIITKIIPPLSNLLLLQDQEITYSALNLLRDILSTVEYKNQSRYNSQNKGEEPNTMALQDSTEKASSVETADDWLTFDKSNDW